jgi:polyisoprenoid-binding protein YceI
MAGPAARSRTIMTSSTLAATRTFAIDVAHSEAVFQVRHLVTKVRGRFREFEGTVDINQEHPEQSSVRATIRAASIDTAQPDRDTHLRSADFFDVERFPTLAFTSTQVARTGNDTFDVTGDLTIRDTTRRVVLPVTFLGAAKDPWGNERMGFEAELAINRKDFGLTWNAALETGGILVGDEVTITLDVEFVKA